MTIALMLVTSLGCGGPMLQNAPKPDPAVVAGAAAALAGAATLADPNGAAKRQEANKPVGDKKPINVKATVPASALDHLDDKKAGSGSGSAVEPAKPKPSNDDDGVPFDQPQR
jgi:hypothetical protein